MTSITNTNFCSTGQLWSYFRLEAGHHTGHMMHRRVITARKMHKNQCKKYRHFCGRMRWANSAKRQRAARKHRGAPFFFISLYSSTCIRLRFVFISTLTQMHEHQQSVSASENIMLHDNKNQTRWHFNAQASMWMPLPSAITHSNILSL